MRSLAVSRAVPATILSVFLLTTALFVAACGSTTVTITTPADSPAASGGAIAAGDTVAARWSDGNLWLATVQKTDGDQITVTWADDGSTETVAAADVRAIPAAAFAVGDKVLAVWSQGRFYPGKVTKVDGTTYTIRWDDGTDPSEVETGRIIAP